MLYLNGGGGEDRRGGRGGEGGPSAALWRQGGGDQDQEEGLARVAAQVTADAETNYDDQLTSWQLILDALRAG